MRLLLLLLLPVAAGCMSAWKSDGPWACEDGAVCPSGYTCDDGVCCVPGGTPACPTLPVDGGCPGGAAPVTLFRDEDGDGVGVPGSGQLFCRAPRQPGWVELDDDCNDEDPFIGPRATERCNALDDNCDGEIDDGLTRFAWFPDGDGDGFGTGDVLWACVQPDGYAPRGGDCDDTDPAIFPGAPEKCDGVDNNCNGQQDDPPFVDAENPGFNDGLVFDCSTGQAGVCAAGGLQCLATTGGTFEKVCVPRTLPSTDVCGDGLDNDCNGGVDNPPGCGGPRDFVTEPGVIITATLFVDAGTAYPAGCLRTGATEPMAWIRPSWIGTNDMPGLHVLAADAPPGTWWDLSHQPALRLGLYSTYVGGTEGFWNTGDRTKTLAVQLCGTGGTFARFIPGMTVQLSAGNRAFTLPLDGGGDWIFTNGGLDLARVDRIELLASPSPQNTFRLTFASDGGGFGFH